MKDEMIALGSDLADDLGFTAEKFEGWLWEKEGAIVVSFIVSNLCLTALFTSLERSLRIAICFSPFLISSCVSSYGAFLAVCSIRATATPAMKVKRSKKLVFILSSL